MEVSCTGVAAILSVVLLLVNQWSVSRAHEHGHHASPASDQPAKFHDAKVVRDPDHIKEHYEGVAQINESTMSIEELEFHYFKLHDFDNNTMLDGLEMYKALTHMMPYEDIAEDLPGTDKVDKKGKSSEQIAQEQKDAMTNYYTEIIDTVLGEDDVDMDGYLSYPEYVLARRREDAKSDLEERQNS